MQTKTRLQVVEAELKQQIRDYLGGHRSRTQLSAWASQQIKAIPSQELTRDEHGQLLDYVLCRLLDDDWVSEDEYREELSDLLARLEYAEKGVIKLP